jgi:predicted GH43/DUF377 family glycosyl hydrolase
MKNPVKAKTEIFGQPVVEPPMAQVQFTRRSAVQLIAGIVCSSRLGMSQRDLKIQSSKEKDWSRWLVPQHWVKQRSKPVIALGKAGEFDDMHIFAPCVGKEDGRYYLWYCGSRGTVAERVFRLGLATSQDAMEFKKVAGGPVYEFGDGNTSVSTPSVLRETDGTLIRENGKLRMWFSGQELNKQGGKSILYEVTGTAPDRWDKPSPPLLQNCYAPTVIRDGTVYRVWYADVSVKPWKFRHAQSNDGIHWSVTEKPVMVVDQAWEASILVYPQVVKVDDVYLMWYGTYWWEDEDAVRWPTTAIGFAVSGDGIEWHKYSGNPVLRPDASLPWETNYNTNQSLIRFPDGSWRVWYGARKQPPFLNKYFSICTATWEGLH